MALAGTGIPGKIVMKGTGKMSLNDRFTIVSRKKPNAGTLQQDQIVKFRSQRVMQQMENRPAVMAAFANQQKKSVMQRLGVRARLGYFGQFGKPQYFHTQRGGGGFTGYRGFGGFRSRGSFIPYGKRNGFRQNGYFNPYRGRGRVFRGGIRKSERGRGGFVNGFKKSGGTQVFKERLDQELDAYMSRGVQLNNTLDTLMAEVH